MKNKSRPVKTQTVESAPSAVPPVVDHTLAFVAVALRGGDVVAAAIGSRQSEAVMQVLAADEFDASGDTIMIGTLTAYVHVTDSRGGLLWPNP